MLMYNLTVKPDEEKYRFAPTQTREEILREVDAWKTKSPDRWHIHLANICRNLPGGSRRTLAQNLRLYDTPIASRNDDREVHSSLYWGQTSGKFFTTIDTVLDTLHISIPSIQDLNRQIDLHYSETETAMVYVRELYNLILPAYIELRVMGYTHHELTG